MKMKDLNKNFVIFVLIFFFITLIFSYFITPTEKKNTTITINEIAKKIQNEEINKIEIEGQNIKVYLKNNEIKTTKKEPETSLSETLKNFGVESEKLQKVELVIKEENSAKYWLSIIIPSILPIIILTIIFWLIFRQTKNGINQAFTFGKANLKIFIPNKDKITFKDVAGLKEAKQELEEVVDFLKNPKKYLDLGARIPRGVLLIGPPGTGKTLLARAVANEAGVPFFHMSASEFVEMFVGVGASRVRDLFQTAKRAGRSIIFIDEIDAVGRERGAGLGGGHDEREQTLNQILVEMDGFEKDDTRIVIAATNRPDILDPALLRPGRFDRRIILDLPDINDREEILKVHAKNKILDKNVDLRTIAIRTPGFSGADLANLMNEAAILAARKNLKTITQQELIEAIEKVMLGPERKSKAISLKEKEVIAYHEAGHALVAASLKEADPVHKISIISRGLAGGYTLKLPTEERYLKTKKQFLADLTTLFGGYTAELEIFKDVTTGASNDLKEATEIARKLVTRYGMNEKLGPRTFGKSEELIFLGREIVSEKDYSEQFAHLIDEEINNIINNTFNLAKKIIKKNKNILKFIAQKLLEKETLEQEEFYQIIKQFNLKPISVKF